MTVTASPTTTWRSPPLTALGETTGYRALMLLASPPVLLPAGIDAGAVCRCGGYLTEADQAGARLHIDTCAEELHAPDLCCPDDRNTHHVCETPAAVLCSHCGSRPNDLNVTPCLGTSRSRHASDNATSQAADYCCGCCHEGDQS